MQGSKLVASGEGNAGAEKREEDEVRDADVLDLNGGGGVGLSCGR